MKLKGEVQTEQPAANEDIDRDIGVNEKLHQLVKDTIVIQSVDKEQVNITLYHQPSFAFSPPSMEKIFDFVSYFIIHTGVFCKTTNFKRYECIMQPKLKIMIFCLHKCTWT